MYEAAISSRALRGSKCSFCSNRYALDGFNDLNTTDPEIAATAFGWDPRSVTRGSGKKRQWKCVEGHIYDAPPMARTGAGKSGCPYCSHQKLLSGFNDLATTNPKAAQEADGWDPSKYIGGNSSIKEWKCPNNHKYKLSINRRNIAEVGCPFCGNRKVMTGFNDLKFTHPAVAKEADGWDPSTVTPGSNEKKQWKCNAGHIYQAIINSRTLQGSGCPVCSNLKVHAGFNDLGTTHPEIAKEAEGWDPKAIIGGTNKKLLWKCPLSHLYKTSPNKRTSRGDACPICSNNELLIGFNDLATKFPAIAAEAEGWDPTRILSGSSSKRKWKCTEGHKYVATLDSRTGNRKSGCPSCSKSGFDPNKDSWLYLLEQHSWRMCQIGITNNADRRMREHKKNGWEVLELRGPMDGHLTQQWESAILRMLKAKGADLSNEKIAGKFDGFSEAWTKATFPVKSIKELMRLTDEYEEGLGKGRRVE